MRFPVVFLALLSGVVLFGADDEVAVPVVREPAPIIKSVSVKGGDIKLKLATKAGDPLDPKRLRKDVQTLWSTGLYEDIQVRTADEQGGAAVTFDVVEKPQLFLRDLRLEPNTYGMQPSLPAGTLVDSLRAQQVAGQIRKRLVEKGYVDAYVEPEIVPLGKKKADLFMHIKAGDSVRVDGVEITGNTVFPQEKVQAALQALKTKTIIPGFPGLWHAWRMHPAYSEAAVQNDLARLQSFYLERGYFDAHVSIDDSDVQGDNAHIKLFVDAGKHYNVKQIEFSGEGIEHNVVPFRGGIFRSSDMCSCLMRARREAEKKGIVDFTARVNFHPSETASGDSKDFDADLSATVETGKAYTINRIDFTGAKHYSEGAIRRNFVLDEGDLLDERQLRKSLSRLNQTQMFEAVDESQVAVTTDERTGTANITVPLVERRRGMWNISGPLGPINLGGALQAMIATRLPDWGQGVFELSTYYLSFTMLGFGQSIGKVIPLALSKQGILPVFSLFRPYTPGEGWKSGFLIAPQLGWQASVLTYGTTQVTSRLVPIIRGEDKFTPQLAVTFERPNGDGVILCEPQKPKFHLARNTLAMILQFAGSAPGLF